MIFLRFVGGPYIDPRFLDITDVPFILIGIFWLIVVYIKTKNKKYKLSEENKSHKTSEEFQLESYDILMQPKGQYNGSLPLINFPFPHISIKELVLGVALIIFYYLIFTETI